MNPLLTNNNNRLARFVGAASAVLLATSLSSSAVVTILAQDDFSGTAAVDLGALSATADVGGRWKATTNINADGSIIDTVGGAAILSFAPIAGEKYILSATVNVGPATTAGAAIGIGFTNTTWAATTWTFAPASATRFANAGSNPGIAWQWTLNGLQNYVKGPAGGTSGIPATSITGTSFDLKTILDTTGANWKVTFFVNGVDQGSFFDTAGNPLLSTIDAVGFSNFGGRTAGSIDNFLLTVPEPSAALLGGIGMLALLRRRRI